MEIFYFFQNYRLSGFLLQVLEFFFNNDNVLYVILKKKKSCKNNLQEVITTDSQFLFPFMKGNSPLTSSLVAVSFINKIHLRKKTVFLTSNRNEIWKSIFGASFSLKKIQTSRKEVGLKISCICSDSDKMRWKTYTLSLFSAAAIIYCILPSIEIMYDDNIDNTLFIWRPVWLHFLIDSITFWEKWS